MADKKERVVVYLPDALKTVAAAKAEELGISLSSMMVLALNQYIQQGDAVTIMKQMLQDPDVLKKLMS